MMIPDERNEGRALDGANLPGLIVQYGEPLLGRILDARQPRRGGAPQ
ncbi:MAG: hypothetical protein GY711_03640 [bacterium]|nr:hypothetical protein [bacterium]